MENKEPKKAVLYTRVSSRKQVKEGNGLESQETMCREHAGLNGITIVEQFYDGGISGKFASREGLDAMIDYLAEANKKFTTIEYVLVDDVDRIIRDVQGRWEIKTRIEGIGGAKIYSLKQDIDDTPEGKMLQSITMSVKQYERENNARRTRDRKRARMIEGFWNLTTVPGYSYKKSPYGSGKMLAPIEEKVLIIKEALELFADGFIANQSALLEFLNIKGLTTGTGNKIHRTYVERMLRRDRLLFYAGYVDYKPWEINMVPGKHERIIDLSTVGKIEQRFERKQIHKLYSESEIAKELPMRGILRCCECEHPMTGSPSKGRLGGQYFYYTCRGKGCGLNSKSYNNHKVHDALEILLGSMHIDPKLYHAFEKVMEDICKEDRELQDNVMKKHEVRVKTIGENIDKLQDRILNADSPQMMDLYEQKISNLLAEKESLQNEIFSNSTIDKQVILQTRQDTKVILENPLFVRQLDNLELKRLMLHILFNGEIYYSASGGLQTPSMSLIYSSFDAIMNGNVRESGPAGIEPTTRGFGDLRSTNELRPCEGV